MNVSGDYIAACHVTAHMGADAYCNCVTFSVHVDRQRRSIVSTEEFEADKDSLRRMLLDFQHDNSRVRWIPNCLRTLCHAP